MLGNVSSGQTDFESCSHLHALCNFWMGTRQTVRKSIRDETEQLLACRL